MCQAREGDRCDLALISILVQIAKIDKSNGGTYPVVNVTLNAIRLQFLEFFLVKSMCYSHICELCDFYNLWLLEVRGFLTGKPLLQNLLTVNVC
jgi:hypothetical protein